MKANILFAFFLGLNSCFSQVTSTPDPVEFKGKWLVTGIFSGYVPSISEDEAKLLIGKELVILDSVYSFESHFIRNPKYKIRAAKSNQYFPVLRMDADEVGILSDSVTVIRALDPHSPDWFEMILDGKRIIGFEEGWFLFFRKK